MKNITLETYFGIPTAFSVKGKKGYGKMTIKRELLITIILSTLLPMIIIPWIGYLYVRNVVKEQLLLQSKRQLEEITRDMEDVLDDVLKVSGVLAIDDEILDIIKDGNSGLIEQLKVIRKLSDANAVYLYRYNAAISLYDNYGRCYSTLGNEQKINAEFRVNWVEETIDNQEYFLWKTFDDLATDEPVMGMSRNFYDQNRKRLGTLCIELYQDRYLSKLLRQDSDLKDTERSLVDENGDFILEYNSMGRKLGFTEEMYQEQIEQVDIAKDMQDILLEEERYIYFQDSIERTGWKMIQVVPYDAVFAKLNYYRNFTYLSNFICLAILLFIDNHTANRIGKALIRLRDAMKQVRKGNFINLENNEKNVEVREIFDDFNNMSNKLGRLFEENRKITEEKEECRLLALQTQIQPHFLFNTLNGIKWLCIIESAPTAERMIESLGHILEYSLGKPRDCVTLKEELNCLTHYIELQKMRYGNIFDVFYQIDSKLEKLEVPVLILQPLVENSIVHGIREKDERGEIFVKAKIKENEIVISVEDNGEGISAERLNQILNKGANEKNIGVINVKERMELYYRDSKFEIESKEGVGTIVKMILRKGEIRNEDCDCG